MKAYLLDLGSKVDFLNWKLDAFQKVVNVTDDILEKIGDGAGYVWQKIENKTEAVWEKVQDHKNKTESLFGWMQHGWLLCRKHWCDA